MPDLSRRSILRAAPAMILAPAIVRAESIMAVKPVRHGLTWVFDASKFPSSTFTTTFNVVSSEAFTDLVIYGQATFDPSDVWRRMGSTT